MARTRSFSFWLEHSVVWVPLWAALPALDGGCQARAGMHIVSAANFDKLKVWKLPACQLSCFLWLRILTQELHWQKKL